MSFLGDMIGGLTVFAAASQLAPDEASRPLPPESIEDMQREILGNCVEPDGEAKRFAVSEALPVLEVALGDRLDDVVGQLPAGYIDPLGMSDTFLHTGRPMRIALNIGAGRIVAKTGGMHNVITLVDASFGLHQVHRVEFYDQQCAVTLQVALERAQALEASLTAAGFKRHPELTAWLEYGEPRPERVRSWEDGAAELRIAPRQLAAVASHWARGTEEAEIAIWNWGADRPDPAMATLFPALVRTPQSVFEVDGTGRKFGVQIRLSDDSIFKAGFDAIDAGAQPQQ